MNCVQLYVTEICYKLLVFKIVGTQVGKLSPDLLTQVQEFLPIARQMSEQLLNRTITNERNFVRRRGNNFF